jgi:hypothetical protein
MSVDAAGTSARATEELRGVVAGAGLYYQDFLLLFGGEVNVVVQSQTRRVGRG